VHASGYGLGGHMVRGGPWRVTIYSLADGLPMHEISVSDWDEARRRAAEWVRSRTASEE
jgi:hypothetical protein